jgi:hypothetical protein
MDETGVVQNMITQLVELEEDRFIVGFHKEVQKE